MSDSVKAIHERLKEKGYPKIMEGPIDIRAYGITPEYVDLLQQRIAELEGDKQRLRDALIPVPDEMSLSQIEAWLERYSVKRLKALMAQQWGTYICLNGKG